MLQSRGLITAGHSREVRSQAAAKALLTTPEHVDKRSANPGVRRVWHNGRGQMTFGH